jgi:hypothetical protein
MRADFRIEMRRYGNACRAGDRRRPQKSGDAADAHQIGHDEVAGLLLQREVNVARAVEIFADLDWRLQLGGEPGGAVEIVVEDRFLDPDKAEIIDHVAAPQGVGEIEGLVEIDHEVDIVADRFPHRLYRREVVARIGAAQPHRGTSAALASASQAAMSRPPESAAAEAVELLDERGGGFRAVKLRSAGRLGRASEGLQQ